jgi:hypothetical protein
LTTVRSKARDQKRVAELRSIEKALNHYALVNDGLVPKSSYSSWADVPKNPDGSINCNSAGLVSMMDNFYETLILSKSLSSKPQVDPLASKGYCYVYITDIYDVVAVNDLSENQEKDNLNLTKG